MMLNQKEFDNFVKIDNENEARRKAYVRDKEGRATVKYTLSILSRHGLVEEKRLFKLIRESLPDDDGGQYTKMLLKKNDGLLWVKIFNDGKWYYQKIDTTFYGCML